MHSHYLDVMKKVLLLFKCCSFLNTRERSPKYVTLFYEIHSEISKRFSSESYPKLPIYNNIAISIGVEFFSVSFRDFIALIYTTEAAIRKHLITFIVCMSMRF